MAFKFAKFFAKWFKKEDVIEEKDNDIEYLMEKINATTSNEVKSLLADIELDEKAKLEKLYKDIYAYVLQVKQEDEVSLINNKCVLEAINSNIGNYEITEKIFNIVKSWDNDTYLPKSIKPILKFQLTDQQIEDLETIYKEVNVIKKDKLKDIKNYYYVLSKESKNRLTESFGDLTETNRILFHIKQLDNSRKISKELITRLGNMLYKHNYDGTKINDILICKVRDIDNYNVFDNYFLNNSFKTGLVNSGNVLIDSNTSIRVKTIYDILKILKDEDTSYSGVIVIEIPKIYFNEEGDVIEEYESKVFKDLTYQIIDPNYLSMYISLNDDRCDYFLRTEFINKEMDIPQKIR